MLRIRLFRNVALFSAIALFLSGCQLPGSAPPAVQPASEVSSRTRANDLADHVAARMRFARTSAADDDRAATRLRFPIKPARDRDLFSQGPAVGISAKNEITETARRDLLQPGHRPIGVASVNSGIQRVSKTSPVPAAGFPFEPVDQPGSEPPLPEPVAASYRAGSDSGEREDDVATIAVHLGKKEIRANAVETLGGVNLQVPRFGHDQTRQALLDRPESTTRVSHDRQLNADALAAIVNSPHLLPHKNDESQVAGKADLLKSVELVSEESSLPPEPAGVHQDPLRPADRNSADDLSFPLLPAGDAPIVEFPIDLPTALRLAGADNWSIRLAWERVREAQARYDRARAMWLPSLNAGLGYTKHDGQIQDTRGEVIDVSRNSLFVGGGAAVADAPLAGGSGGPLRFQVDLSLADALFEPLATRQLVRAEQAGESATFNDTLLAVALAYYDLVDGQAQRTVGEKNLSDAEMVLGITEAFVAAGKGAAADTTRVLVETTQLRQEIVLAEMNIRTASAELARLIQLDPKRFDPNAVLVSLDAVPLTVELVPDTAGLDGLILQAQRCRPEMIASQALVEAGRQRARAERWRPWIPNVHVGASAGGFGGGVNDSLSQLDGRGDIDVLAVWQLRNLGVGTHAVQRERSSQFRQEMLAAYSVRDLIAAEVESAYYQVQAQRRQLDLAETNVGQAEESLRQNINRIRNLEGLPLEAIQALNAVAEARRRYVAATIDYNRAQLQLLRAIGQPPAA